MITPTTLARHRPYVVWMGAEAAANILLSVFLAQRLGLVGVAWGKVIPNVAILLLMARHCCSVVGLPVRQFVQHAWLLPLVSAAPFAAVCAVTEHVWTPNNLARILRTGGRHSPGLCRYLCHGVPGRATRSHIDDPAEAVQVRRDLADGGGVNDVESIDEPQDRPVRPLRES